MSENYRKALNSRIKAGKVYLNDKNTIVTGYEERENYAVVIVDGKEWILTESDNLIVNGNEKYENN